MQCFDIFVLIFSLLIISVYGLLKSRVRENNSAHEVLIGSGLINLYIVFTEIKYLLICNSDNL
uniref:7TM_GPCR_Srx domain-containing protein n=1 Tax=Heterorhabditis bacteriophora TaxID=37862 RepID=A0A1I7WEQ5_HETBA